MEGYLSSANLGLLPESGGVQWKQGDREHQAGDMPERRKKGSQSVGTEVERCTNQRRSPLDQRSACGQGHQQEPRLSCILLEGEGAWGRRTPWKSQHKLLNDGKKRDMQIGTHSRNWVSGHPARGWLNKDPRKMSTNPQILWPCHLPWKKGLCQCD